MTRFRVIDVETTGLDPQIDQICSVAWVDVQNGEVLGTYYSLVNPGMSIPPQASGIHHITNADVANAPKIGEIWSKLIDPSVDLLVAHNAEFDMGMLHITGPAFCTYRAAQHVWPDAPDFKNMTLRYWLGLDCSKVAGQPAHRADVDAYVTAQILIRLLQEPALLGMTPEEMVAFADRPVRQKAIRFGKHAGKAWSELPWDYLQWMKRQSWDKDTRWNLDQAIKQRRTA